MTKQRRRNIADDWARIGVIQEVINRHTDAEIVAVTYSRSWTLRCSRIEDSGRAPTIPSATAGTARWWHGRSRSFWSEFECLGHAQIHRDCARSPAKVT